MEKKKNWTSTKVSQSYDTLVGGERDRERKSLSVSSDRHTELKEQLRRELLAELRPLAPGRIMRKQVIGELVSKNERVTVTDVLISLKIKGANYARELMREVSQEKGFVYVKGGACRESYLSSAKFEGQNKVLWAFSQTYKSITSQPIGTTKRVSSIAKEFNLSHHELQSVVGLLAQQQEIFIQTSSMGFSERRIKRVR